MQDDYKTSVTTQKMQAFVTYYFGLSSDHLSESVEYPHDYKRLVVVLLTHKQLNSMVDLVQLYLQLLSHWVGLLMLHWKSRYIQVFG
jgi:hypothetical protein